MGSTRSVVEAIAFSRERRVQQRHLHPPQTVPLGTQELINGLLDVQQEPKRPAKETACTFGQSLGCGEHGFRSAAC